MMNNYTILTLVLLAVGMYGSDDQCSDSIFQDRFHPIGIACKSGALEIKRGFFDDRTYSTSFCFHARRVRLILCVHESIFVPEM